MPNTTDRAARKALGTLQNNAAQTQRLRGSVPATSFSVAANSTTDLVLFTSGPIPRDTVTVSPVANLPPGMTVGATKVPANGQIAVRLANLTAGPLTVPAGNWGFILQRTPPGFGG